MKTLQEKIDAMLLETAQAYGSPVGYRYVLQIDKAVKELREQIKAKQVEASEQIVKWQHKRGVKSDERLHDGYAKYTAYDDVLAMLGEKK